MMTGDARKALLYTGMFLVISISFRHPAYRFCTFRFCRGRADFFIRRNRMADLSVRISMMKIPAIQIQKRIVQRQEGVSLLTDRVKSFIQSEDAADMLIASEKDGPKRFPGNFPQPGKTGKRTGRSGEG